MGHPNIFVDRRLFKQYVENLWYRAVIGGARLLKEVKMGSNYSGNSVAAARSKEGQRGKARKTRARDETGKQCAEPRYKSVELQKGERRRENKV